jgi:cytochrome c biogenesis factor
MSKEKYNEQILKLNKANQTKIEKLKEKYKKANEKQKEKIKEQIANIRAGNKRKIEEIKIQRDGKL